MTKKIIKLISNMTNRLCYDKNFKEKQTIDNINIAEEILKSIEQDNNLTKIPSALCMLLSNNEKLKLKVSITIYNAMKKISPDQLPKLDLLFRQRTSMSWTHDWANENPNNLLCGSMSSQEKITILGLCSFHPNGYFREKAIKLLSEFHDGSVIPYMLIRLNDWTYDIRKLSKDVLKSKITIENVDEIINNISLVFRLDKCMRDNYEEIINMITDILISDKCRNELLAGLKSKNQKVRLCCYEILMNNAIVDNATLIEYIIKEKAASIRLKVICYLLKNFSADEIKLFYKSLLNDKNPSIRSNVLLAISKYDFISISNELENALLDRSSTMRYTARALLKNKGFNAFGQFYRDAIIRGESLPGTICGLGETGTYQDCKYIECYTDTENTRLMHAVMLSLGRLDYYKYKEFFIAKLTDERAGISKQARQLLTKQIDSFDGELIYQMNKKAKHRHVIINTLLLLFSLSKWDNIKYILEFCSSNDEEICNLAKHELVDWKFTFSRSFNKPREEQKKLINEAIEEYGKYISREDIEFIMHKIKET